MHYLQFKKDRPLILELSEGETNSMKRLWRLIFIFYGIIVLLSSMYAYVCVQYGQPMFGVIIFVFVILIGLMVLSVYSQEKNKGDGLLGKSNTGKLLTSATVEFSLNNIGYSPAMLELYDTRAVILFDDKIGKDKLDFLFDKGRIYLGEDEKSLLFINEELGEVSVIFDSNFKFESAKTMLNEIGFLL